MCGRYEIVDGKQVFTPFRVPTPQVTLFADNRDIRPTTTVSTIVTDHALTMMRWGLIPSWAKGPRIGAKLFNARAETVAEKPSFKKALHFQRCLIPASALFEWQGAPGAKVKQRIARRDGELFGFAGLYDTWTSPEGQRIATCKNITGTPNRVLAPIHNRMPVIFLPDDEEAWLDPDLTEAGSLVAMLKPYLDDLLVATAA